MHMPNENANNAIPVTFEGQQPQPVEGALKNLESMLKVTSTHIPHSPPGDQCFMLCLSPTPRELLYPALYNRCISQ